MSNSETTPFLSSSNRNSDSSSTHINSNYNGDNSIQQRKHAAFNIVPHKLPTFILIIEQSLCLPIRIPQPIKRSIYSLLVWILTFISYASFHLSRKPISVVKSTLRPNCYQPEEPFINASGGQIPSFNICTPGWPPFTGSDGNILLGSLDYSFLFSYAIAMFFSGHIADRVPLRYFLFIGMIGSGITTCLFGLGYFLNIHLIEYFIAVQIVSGIFQSIGWPSVVAIMTQWYGLNRRGLITGIWNAHTSIGNILGSVIPGIWADTDWGWSFVSAGLIIIFCGLLIFLTLVTDPFHLGLPPPDHNEAVKNKNESRQGISLSICQSNNGDINNLTNNHKSTYPVPERQQTKAIGFIRAIFIPGVIEYSISLFFGKLVSYTFLFWLPLYIHNTKIAGVHYNAMISADLSAIFDVGGLLGGILGGLLSDLVYSRSTVCIVMYFISIPILYTFFLFGYISLALNICLMFLCGFFVNGPYSLITTAVAADLATHESIRGNTHAFATVAAIIDGTGSIGAAIGPILAGWVSTYGWNYVFYIQMASCLIAAIFLFRVVIKDLLKFAKYVNCIKAR